MKHLYVFIVLVALSIGTIKGREIAKNDYKRTVDLYDDKKVFNPDTRINWYKDNSGFRFIDYYGEANFYKILELKSNRINLLFDRSKVVKALGELFQNDEDENRLERYDIEKPAKGQLSFKQSGKSYVLDPLTYGADSSKDEDDGAEENDFTSKSPVGRWIAYTKDFNLCIKSTESQEEIQLSFDGRKNYGHGSWYARYYKMEGEKVDLPEPYGVNWSEDSKWISTNAVDLRHAGKMYLLDYGIDSLYHSKLWSYYRGSPGDTTMAYLKPVFFNVATKNEVKYGPSRAELGFVVMAIDGLGTSK